MLYVILCYILIMNLTGILIMGIDKSKASRGAWRIPEKVLFGVSFFGGSVGTWAGMYLFRHKTRHWYFVIGMPLILVIHICLVLYLLKIL